MSNDNGNRPATACQIKRDSNSYLQEKAMNSLASEYITHTGLTKREKYAGMMAAAIITGALSAGQQMDYADVARGALLQADALLAALDKGE